jgi:hypothetical protein
MKGNFERLSLNFLSPLVGWAVPDPNGGPIWWTINGGTTWRPIVIVASPYRIATS